MQILNCGKLYIVQRIKVKLNLKKVLNYIDEIKIEKDDFKKYQDFINEKRDYVIWCKVNENEVIKEKIELILNTDKSNEFWKYIDELQNEILNFYWLVENEVNLLLTYNNIWFQINQYYDIKTIEFYDFYKQNNSNEIKPQNIELLFSKDQTQKLKMDIFNKDYNVKWYEKISLGYDNFPIELKEMWDVSFGILKTNFSRIFVLLNDKYEIKILINKEDNSIVGFWIVAKSFKWKNVIEEDGNIIYKSFVNNLLSFQKNNDTANVMDVVCYLLKENINVFENDNDYIINEISWDDVDYVNKTLCDDLIWVTMKNVSATTYSENGFYLFLNDKFDKELSEEKIEKDLRNKYVIKRVFNRSTNWEVCCFLNKK